MWARQRPLKSADCITKEGYVQFMARVYRAMHHPVNAKIDQRLYHAMPGKKPRAVRVATRPFTLDARTRAAIEDDWVADAGGSTTMAYGAFHDAMFEVADMWTSFETTHIYVIFLNMLWICLTTDGLTPRPLEAVPAYNEVAYSKQEGVIRGPATMTQAMNPVSTEGNSNWLSVTLPSTFFPDADAAAAAADKATFVAPPVGLYM